MLRTFGLQILRPLDFNIDKNKSLKKNSKQNLGKSPLEERITANDCFLKV